MYKFKGKSIEEYHTHHEVIEEGEMVEGYYYFSRTRNQHIILTRMSQECGGIGSGIVEVEIAVDPSTVEQIEPKKHHYLKLVEVLEELLEVANLRGDNELPHPADDPKLWTARMQIAWDEAQQALAAIEGGKG